MNDIFNSLANTASTAITEGLRGTINNLGKDLKETYLPTLGKEAEKKVTGLFGNKTSTDKTSTDKSMTKTFNAPKKLSKSVILSEEVPYESGGTEDFYVPNNMISRYRVMSSVIKLSKEYNDGLFTAAVTYVTNSKELDKYKQNPKLITQEWIQGTQKNGIRVIKIPKDDSDHMFKGINTANGTCEQAIIIHGQNLNQNDMVIGEIIQHVEFIPTIDYMQIFTPKIPMFGLGSEREFKDTISKIPIIGPNGNFVINDPTKVESLMNYLSKYPNLNTSLFNILTDTSYLNEEMQKMIELTF